MTLMSFPTDVVEEVVPTPNELLAILPSFHTGFIEESRETIRSILSGADPRLLLIVGPCSIHDLDAAYEYATRLKKLSDRVSDSLFLVMRTYFEKPRTKRGWKGLLYDPHLDGSHAVSLGLKHARQLLIDLAELGLPAGSELLEINTAPYLTDLLSWGCIGARTCSSQPHRQLASGVPFPVGFKNATDGSIAPALHGINSAAAPHAYLGLLPHGQVSRIQTDGNPDCHLILRGSDSGPNYSETSIATAVAQSAEAHIYTRLLIDCSHGNCGKRHENQIAAFQNVLRQIHQGNPHIGGLMLESHLHAGAQPLSDDLRYGVSVTDPCLDWATTEALILEAAS